VLLTLAAPARPTFSASDTHPFTRVVATADGPAYSFTRTGASLTVVAGRSGGNEREFFVPSDAPVTHDQQSCAEWSSQPSVAQQGAVFRLHTVAGGIQAITVTKNIFFHAFWIINVHVWNTTDPSPYTLVASFDLSSELEIPGTNNAYPLPWFFCAAVRGSTVAFKVWRNGQSEPAWGDTRYGAITQLPAGHTDPGTTGWYVGHLSGSSASFTHLTTSTWDPQQVHAAPTLQTP
jgi:hypothetical protein